MELTKEQKRNALANLNLTPQEKILELIQDGVFTFEELQDTGKFSREKQDWVREQLDEIKRKAVEEERKKMADNEVEENYWKDCEQKRTISAYKEYIAAYPHGKYVNIANGRIATLERELIEEQEKIYRTIEADPNFYTIQRIKEMLNEGKITEQGIIERNIATPEALEVFLDPPDYVSRVFDWEDLPPLPADNTDIYFFGIPRSGKSCVLSGMFYQAEKAGMLDPDISNHEGVRYLNELKQCVYDGYVPPSTPTDTVNFIATSLYLNERKYPVSVIEMSGEFFKATYERASTKDKNTIGAKGYLHNNNRKVIFLVVDYFADAQRGRKRTMAESQQDLLIYCLKTLERDGTLAKTDSIQVVVTKADLMQVSDDELYDKTKEFVVDNYANLINNIKRVNKKYGINKNDNYGAVVLPFSLGRFMLGKTFEFEENHSNELLKSLLNSTASKKEKRSILGLFNRD